MEKLIKSWKTCPLCGREANFVCEKYTATCKNCGAKWEEMWRKELGLTKPCTDGVGKIYVGVETAKIMALCLVGCGIAMSIVIAYALIEAGGLFEFIFARLGKGDKPEFEGGVTAEADR